KSRAPGLRGCRSLAKRQWRTREAARADSSPRRHFAELGDRIPVAGCGFLRENFIKRIELGVGKSIRAVEVDFSAGAMKSLGSDLQRGERGQGRRRQGTLQERDRESSRVDPFFLQERVTRQ